MVKRKYVKLSVAHKEEIRRLTQFANRRIRQAQKVYAREGKDILPRDIVGKQELQIKDTWHTNKNPLSRSTKFRTTEDFEQHMKFLRSFEDERPTVGQYTKIQHERTLKAVKNTLGYMDLEQFEGKIRGMTAPQQDEFWKKFGRKAQRKGMSYDSEQVLRETMAEFFPEDREHLLDV